MRPKRRHNPKREFADDPPAAELRRIAEAVRYGGNPEHKRNPGDFGLTPPAAPRLDKTLCDEVRIFDRATATEHLRRGLLRGWVSDVPAGGWPQNIWSVTEQGEALEAQLENAMQGIYHGYPLQESDPFRDEVLRRWQERVGDER